MFNDLSVFDVVQSILLNFVFRDIIMSNYFKKSSSFLLIFLYTRVCSEKCLKINLEYIANVIFILYNFSRAGMKNSKKVFYIRSLEEGER